MTTVLECRDVSKVFRGGDGSPLEVLSGVDLGDEVVVGDAARTIAPGMRVRVREREERASS